MYIEGQRGKVETIGMYIEGQRGEIHVTLYLERL
jgi:hypothetical protein